MSSVPRLGDQGAALGAKGLFRARRCLGFGVGTAGGQKIPTLWSHASDLPVVSYASATPKNLIGSFSSITDASCVACWRS